MNRVLIWDYTGLSSQWLEQVADMSDIEVVATMTPSEPVPEILLKKDIWDWLLIFERGARAFFNATIQILNLPTDKVIYALDINSWLQRPKAIYNILSMAGGGVIRRWYTLNSCREMSNFVACTIEDISYVATAADDMIMREMFVDRRNWAAGSIKRFHELTKKYYAVDDSAGYFLDLGANIGTTGIYFTSKLAPNLKLLAFEPDPENFKLHRINLILNDMEGKATVINCGLGDKFDTMTMYRDIQNPGHNNLTEPNANVPTETIKIMPLDDYLAENKIAASEVKYIWLDTEGFEPQVLLGAKNLFAEKPLPLFMECNLKAWDNSGYFDDMMALLAKNYSHFMLFSLSGKESLHSLEELTTLERANNNLGQVGDIFLIRKGSI